VCGSTVIPTTTHVTKDTHSDQGREDWEGNNQNPRNDTSSFLCPVLYILDVPVLIFIYYSINNNKLYQFITDDQMELSKCCFAFARERERNGEKVRRREKERKRERERAASHAFT
jgi:hypothetical protein